MSTYFSDAEEYTRRSRLAECTRRTPAPPRARTRTRVATGLRRVADRLEQ